MAGVVERFPGYTERRIADRPGVDRKSGKLTMGSCWDLLPIEKITDEPELSNRH